MSNTLEELMDFLSKGDIEEAITRARLLEKNDKSAWNKFVVYLDLRTKGKKVSISNIGPSLGILDRNNKLTALVLVISENESINMEKIIDLVKFAKSMRMEIFMALVDKYGDITYYTLEEINLTK
ncbi:MULTISPECIES: ribonuclease BN [Metallosphaera]|uniref:ribonuclease BN n=1 Tax=Metallosphaera TaxID=41980 RepID=UPI001F060F46|nr:ribonuclease BN [Metallosphaera sedula]MCH1771761.1 ribonuclease BN [Metallosphaera sedula]MCP6729929.1 ribonuclease BN [Metallosphaera sedula]